MLISHAISIRIKEILKTRKITQYKLKQMIGIPHNSMLCIMGHRYNSANLKTIFIIIDTLGMTIPEFFTSPLFDLANLNLD